MTFVIERFPMSSIAAVILAAGASTRMGRPKPLLEYHGQTLLRRAALAALQAQCRPVVVVTGAHADQCKTELGGLDLLEATNPHWQRGLGSSVRIGVQAALQADPGIAAVVLMLCDQPLVTSQVVCGLIAAYRRTVRPIVATRHEGSFGAPALFSRGLLPELVQIEDGAGAKSVIQRHLSEVEWSSFPESGLDVDTPQDFERLLSATHDRDVINPGASLSRRPLME